MSLADIRDRPVTVPNDLESYWIPLPPTAPSSERRA